MALDCGYSAREHSAWRRGARSGWATSWDRQSGWQGSEDEANDQLRRRFLPAMREGIASGGGDEVAGAGPRKRVVRRTAPDPSRVEECEA